MNTLLQLQAATTLTPTEAAQAVLGHRQLETTQVYAEVNLARGVEAMERLG